MSEVRRGEMSDAPTCAAILNAWIDGTEWMPRVHPPEDVVGHYQETVFAKREVWVIGRPVRAYLSLDGGNYVTSLYSSVPCAGLGKSLLDHAKDLRHHLQLWTFVANAHARRFYAREGFVEVERSDGDNEEGLPDIRYEWRAA